MNGSRCCFPEFVGHIDSFAEILSLRAEKTPDRVLFRYLGDGENESAAMTYGQLDQKARGLPCNSLKSAGPATGRYCSICRIWITLPGSWGAYMPG